MISFGTLWIPTLLDWSLFLIKYFYSMIKRIITSQRVCTAIKRNRIVRKLKL